VILLRSPLVLLSLLLLLAGGPAATAAQFGWIEDAANTVAGGITDAANTVADGVQIGAGAVGKVVVQGWSGISDVGRRGLGEIEGALEKGVRELEGAAGITEAALKKGIQELADGASAARQWIRDNEELLEQIGMEVALGMIRGALIAAGLPALAIALDIALRQLKSRYLDGQGNLSPQQMAEIATARMPLAGLVVRQHGDIRNAARAAYAGDFEELGLTAHALATSEGRRAIRQRLASNPRSAGQLATAMAALDQYESEFGFTDVDGPPVRSIRIPSAQVTLSNQVDAFLTEWRAQVSSLQGIWSRCYRDYGSPPRFWRQELGGTFDRLARAKAAFDTTLGAVAAPGCFPARGFLDREVRSDQVSPACFLRLATLDDLGRALASRAGDLAALRTQRDAIVAEARAEVAALDRVVLADLQSLQKRQQAKQDLAVIFRKTGSPANNALRAASRLAKELPELVEVLEDSAFAKRGRSYQQLELAREGLPGLAALAALDPDKVSQRWFQPLVDQLANAPAARRGCAISQIRRYEKAEMPAYVFPEEATLREWRDWCVAVGTRFPEWLIGSSPAEIAGAIRGANARAEELREELNQAVTEAAKLEDPVAAAIQRWEHVVAAYEAALKSLDSALSREGALAPLAGATPRDTADRLQMLGSIPGAIRDGHLPEARRELELLQDQATRMRDLRSELALVARRLAARERFTLEDYWESLGPEGQRGLERIGKLSDGLRRLSARSREEVDRHKDWLRRGSRTEPVMGPALQRLLPLDSETDLTLDRMRAKARALQYRIDDMMSSPLRSRDSQLVARLQKELSELQGRIRWLETAEERAAEEARRKAEEEAERRRLEEERKERDAARRERWGEAADPDDFVGLNLGGMSVSDSTRWQTAKKRLGDGLRSYVDKNIQGFLEMFSPRRTSRRTPRCPSTSSSSPTACAPTASAPTCAGTATAWTTPRARTPSSRAPPTSSSTGTTSSGSRAGSAPRPSGARARPWRRRCAPDSPTTRPGCPPTRRPPPHPRPRPSSRARSTSTSHRTTAPSSTSRTGPFVAPPGPPPPRPPRTSR
jgi:TolA-binding protein